VRLILGIVAAAGIIFVGAVFPNIFKMVPRSWLKRYPKKLVDQTIERLKRRGLLRLVSGPRGSRLELTEKGRAELLGYELRQKLLRRPKRWRGKWHLLIFDIDEKRKPIRDQVRRTLSNLGFYRLQDSVWVFPHECEEILELLRTKYKVRYDALYIRAEKIVNDRWLRRHFGIKES